MNPPDVLAFVASSLIGFISGYGVCWMIERAHEDGRGGQGGAGGEGGHGGAGDLGEAGGQGGAGGEGGRSGHPTAGSGLRRLNGRAFLGILILLLVAGTAALAWQSAVAQRDAAVELQRFTACQTAQNKAFTVAIAARSQATHDSNAALRALLAAVAAPGVTSEGKQKAYADYLAALDKVDQIQAANPLLAGNC